MGRNKYAQKEVDAISKLLQMKSTAKRGKQKEIRHILRTEYEFNISDFNEPGKAFGPEELLTCIRRGAIQILDDQTIEAMKEKRARDRQRDMEQREQEAIASGEQTSWQEALRLWNEQEGIAE